MIVALIIGIIIVAIAAFLLYRLTKVKRQNRWLHQKRLHRVEALHEKLESSQGATAEDVLPFAQNFLTRELTYQLLRNRDKLHLFPDEYFTIVKFAENHLSNWLEFPTELDASPDEIEHIKRVTIDFDGQNHFLHYEVFKYKTYAPHWAAEDGWILGVVGPYFDESNPDDYPGATFSRISSTADKVTPEEEAKWVHKNIAMRK